MNQTHENWCPWIFNLTWVDTIWLNVWSLSRCWLNPIPFYASFLAPVAIIIIINFIVFFLVLRQLWGASTRNLNKTDSTKTSSRLRGAVTLVIMLGLTWVFAILAIDGGAPVFQYLFTVFNSLQGLFIFVFHCLLKTDAQKAWKKACCGGEKEKDSKTSKGTLIWDILARLLYQQIQWH